MSLLGLCALLLVALGVWLAKGLAQALRDRIAERVATWAIPDGQAWTYRLAVGVAWLAEIVNPKRRRLIFHFWVGQESDLPFGDDPTRELRCEAHERPEAGVAGGLALGLTRRLQSNVFPWLHARGLDYSARFVLIGTRKEEEWSRPTELLAELEANLLEETPVDGPFSMSRFVMVEALRRRGRAIVEGLLWPPLGIVAICRSTKAVALLEARAYAWRYPRAGVRSSIRSSATVRVLTGRSSVEQAADEIGVPHRVVRRWVAMARRDAKDLTRDMPFERREAAKLAQSASVPQAR